MIQICQYFNRHFNGGVRICKTNCMISREETLVNLSLYIISIYIHRVERPGTIYYEEDWCMIRVLMGVLKSCLRLVSLLMKGHGINQLAKKSLVDFKSVPWP